MKPGLVGGGRVAGVMSSVPGEFLAAVAEGVGPHEVAAHLGVSLDTVRLWLSRLEDLTTGLTVTGNPLCDAGNAPPIVPGLTLIHTPDVLNASPHCVVTFTADVMNDGRAPLLGITVIPYLRRGGSMGTARYVYHFKSRSRSTRILGTLEAGAMCSTSFRYRVTEQDVRRGVDLVSRVKVRAATEEGGEVTDECEARVRLVT